MDNKYCLNEYTCKHRKKCKRWLGNYKPLTVIDITTNPKVTYIDDEKCINSEPMRFKDLVRFRYSDGSEI